MMKMKQILSMPINTDFEGVLMYTLMVGIFSLVISFFIISRYHIYLVKKQKSDETNNVG